jgi:arylsulfatase A-like enzyme
VSTSGGKSPRPNVVLILNDDMGFSDLGCCGGEVSTPNLDRLASGGVRFVQFYNTARCCPSRASLLTGLHPHQAGVGHMMSDLVLPGYRGDLVPGCVTIAEVLRAAGYGTYMSGKWHVSRHLDSPKDNWPCQRGFDRYWGTITGANSYFDPDTLTSDNERIKTPEGPFYYTDAISDRAAGFIRDHATRRPEAPFFSYVAYTAPHWPLQALPEDIERYRSRFDAGWDRLREERLERMRSIKVLDPRWGLSARDSTQPSWSDAADKAWQLRRMEVYAAQIDRMDQGIGRIVAALQETGQLDNTLLLFLADNGGCAEELRSDWLAPLRRIRAVPERTRDGRHVAYGNDPREMPGAEQTYQSYGVPWANLSNTPFRYYKHWVHEGGIATPLIAHWPLGVSGSGRVCHEPAQLPDIMATCVDVCGAQYPRERNGVTVKPPQGASLGPLLEDRPMSARSLFWEHEGNCAVRQGQFKLVKRYPGDWELYDMSEDRSELSDLAPRYADLVRRLAGDYGDWANRCEVAPWDQVQGQLRKIRE